MTNLTASVTFSDDANTNKSLDDSSFDGGVSVTGPEIVSGADYKAYIIEDLKEMFPLIQPKNFIVHITTKMAQQLWGFIPVLLQLQKQLLSHLF